jgi:hypothetical protein
LGETHLRIVFGLASFDRSSSCSLCPSTASNNTGSGALPIGIFFDTEEKDLSGACFWTSLIFGLLSLASILL